MTRIRPAVPALTLAAVLALGGCMTNEQGGQIIGAVAGGVLGSKVGGGHGKTAATIAGTMIGAHLGGRIGRTMDEQDRQRTSAALEHNRTDQRSRWTNPDTGYDYEVTPTRTYQTDTGPCREYTTEAWIDGRRETIYGTACRGRDGTWQAANR